MHARLYHNLNPSAAIRINRNEIVTLQPFFGQFRMTRPDFHGQLLPHARFVFVTGVDGGIQMHPRYRHPAIANGKPVLYAGEAQFLHGRLQWWSNASGNYRPDVRHAEQAGLPMDRFLSYQEVRAGMPHPETRTRLIRAAAG